jgi:hypothetical protein
MNKNIKSEEYIKNIISELLNEEVSKVSRQDFGRVQFKIEELQNSLNETIKELRKLGDAVPSGLKTSTRSKISGISNNLYSAQKLISQLKDKVKQHKKSVYNQQIDEKKK